MKAGSAVALLSVCLLLSFAGNARPIRKNLHDGWKFRQVRGYNSYPATVPGVVHTDLMDNGIIEDPFVRLNERGVQWVDKEDWIYTLRFDADAQLMERDNVSLVFEGLDTYAVVILNGDTIITADNMFRRWAADVKPILKPEGNELQVYFHSPIKVAMPMWEATPWREIIESGNDQSANGGVFDRRMGVFVRKAGYHFGWDWGPRLVTSGIWRPVYLEAWSDTRIEDVFYRQLAVDRKKAEIEVVVSTESMRGIPDAVITVTNLTDGKRVARHTGGLSRPEGRTTLRFTMNNPRLWWTNGLGGQPLYDFEVKLEAGGKVVDSHRQRLGIRSLRLVTEPDRWGESFYFELNGVPVFMKGANFIPCDSFLPRVTDEIYEKTIRDAVAANMNMLRVWGGGIYENDIFYDLCDRYGILVWQDFMFACALYPAEGEFMENIKAEARENVRRLRNHTCLALWCGNNECEEMWYAWGVKKRYERHNQEWADIQWRQFTDLYYKVLPEIVAECHPGVAYRKSSPYIDDNGKRSDSVGDCHDWGVWGGAAEFELYNQRKSRFFSEYGFQGFPSLQSIKRFAPRQDDWSVTSEVMLSHQRAGSRGNQNIEKMLTRDYGQARDFECFAYMSQLMQADAMKMAMESHRRQKPRCMGSLIWQHNDCWPAASWSSRDWYGNWKAQQYAIRRAFGDILISTVEEEGMVRFFAVSDRLERVEGKLSVKVYSLTADAFRQVKDMRVVIPANGCGVVWECAPEALWGGHEKKDVVVSVSFTDGKGKVYANTYLPVKNRYAGFGSPRIGLDFAAAGNDGGTYHYDVTLTSDVFARGVYLVVDGIDDYFVDDNYFDLLPGERKTIRITHNGRIDDIEARLRAISFADVRKKDVTGAGVPGLTGAKS